LAAFVTYWLEICFFVFNSLIVEIREKIVSALSPSTARVLGQT